MRRALYRQLQVSLAELAPDMATLGEWATLDEVESAISSALVAANERADAAEGATRRLADALDEIGQGVVICDDHGGVVLRNTEAATLVRGRGGDVIAEQAVSEALAEALNGGRPEQTLERFAPSRRTLLIRAFPLYAGPPAASTSDRAAAADPAITPDHGAPPAGRHDADRLGEAVQGSERNGPEGRGSAGSVTSGSVTGGSGAPSTRPGDAGSPDEIIGAVAVVDDISQRRRLEDVRRDFVANVSHELKTPVGALSLLAETLDGEDDPEIVGRLSARVAAEADRLGRIIDDLLDLSRIEANESPVQEDVALQRILQEAIDPLRAVAHSHDIEIQVVKAAPTLAIPGDRRDLVSAVGNLVDNAVKYSEPGSRVTVDVSWGRQWIDISVSDQGIGIPSRDLERIFERFYRVDRARSRSTGGTGLGLAIVRHVAVNHGGSVSVRSVEGEGSTFTLRLPVAPPGGGRPCPR